jgi:hypothetical protein
MTPGQRLEQYTIKRPQEVLLVTIELEGEIDQITIYKGFSSSLVKQTNFDPDVPLISDRAKIIEIERLRSPYQPENPDRIQTGLTWENMETILTEMSI